MFERFIVGLDYDVREILVSELVFQYIPYNLSASSITSSVDIYLRLIFTAEMLSFVLWLIFIRLFYDVREIIVSELVFEYPYNLSASSITYCITSSVDIYLRSIFTAAAHLHHPLSSYCIFIVLSSISATPSSILYLTHLTTYYTLYSTNPKSVT